MKQMFRKSIFRAGMLLGACLLLAGISIAQQNAKWRQPRLLITPGVGLGPLKIGEKIPQQAFDLLGSPTRKSPYLSDDGKPIADASVYGVFMWRDPSKPDYYVGGIDVFLKDGLIEEIKVLNGVRAYTSEGVTMGSSFEKARKIYPQAKVTSLGGGSMGKVLTIPGLSIQDDLQGPMGGFASRKLVQVFKIRKK